MTRVGGAIAVLTILTVLFARRAHFYHIYHTQHVDAERNSDGFVRTMRLCDQNWVGTKSERLNKSNAHTHSLVIKTAPPIPASQRIPSHRRFRLCSGSLDSTLRCRSKGPHPIPCLYVFTQNARRNIGATFPEQNGYCKTGMSVLGCVCACTRVVVGRWRYL